MSNERVSCRGFFRNAAKAASAGAVEGIVAAAGFAAQLPSRVWTIVGVNWEYNDEFHYEVGEFAMHNVYFDEALAQVECQKLNDAFCESAQEFQPCWECYEVDPDTASWDELIEAGFPPPYSVQELEA